MAWGPFDNGATIDKRGSENGITLSDEEHDLGARITLERQTDHAPFAITCGIYGWMFHTRFFGSEANASAEFERMKGGLGAILNIIPRVDDPETDAKYQRVADAIGAFVEQFP
jgi:hypothetical protein